jgi:hypothetical protein
LIYTSKPPFTRRKREDEAWQRRKEGEDGREGGREGRTGRGDWGYKKSSDFYSGGLLHRLRGI